MDTDQAAATKVTVLILVLEGAEISSMASLVARQAGVLVTMMTIGVVRITTSREVPITTITIGLYMVVISRDGTRGTVVVI
jgi:uncharacterized membrane protein YvlD (DUF360 family)